jgi:hypothetical protein
MLQIYVNHGFFPIFNGSDKGARLELKKLESAPSAAQALAVPIKARANTWRGLIFIVAKPPICYDFCSFLRSIDEGYSHFTHPTPPNLITLRGQARIKG